MEQIYALIKNGIVTGLIVADESTISIVADQCDSYVRVDQLSTRPGIDWTYDGNVFTNPNALPDVPFEGP